VPDELFNFDTDFGARYDQFVRTLVFGYESMFNLILALLQTRVGSEARVLVVGSGTGAEVVTFGQAMPGWTFTAVDPSPKMVEQCRAKLQQAGLAGRVDLRQGYIEDVPSGEQFDLATLVLVLHFVPDDGSKLALLRGIAERLKPGGVFVLVQHSGDPESPAFQGTLSVLANYQILAGLPPEQARNISEEAVKTHYFVSEERTNELLTEAGFVEVERFYGALMTGGWVARRA
jgi:tRNA (cmo5U34)-methyltransferase